MRTSSASRPWTFGLEDAACSPARRCGTRARTWPGSRSPRSAPGGCGRPASSFSSVIRAISRRTPSKPERTTALGVSSMMKSTPVRFSRARMLRPFAADDAALHVVGRAAARRPPSSRPRGRRAQPLHDDGRGCCARADRRRAWSPPRSGGRARAGVVADLVLSSSLSSSCLACAAEMPAARSSWRSSSRRSAASSSLWRSSADDRSSSARSRRATSARCASSASSLPDDALLVAHGGSARRSYRTGSGSGHRPVRARGPVRFRSDPVRRARRGEHQPHCQQRRRDHDLHCGSSSSSPPGGGTGHYPFG